MPIGVVLDEAGERRDLKSCPPDGYVLIRRMNYGEKLERRKFNSKMEMKMTKGSRDATSIIDMFKEEMELYDFAHCITEHNITDKDGGLLDFRKPSHVKMLQGRIAEEIGKYIDELNNFEDDEDVEKSDGESVSTS